MVLGAVRTAASTFAERTHAILIGISPYDDPAFEHLPSPSADVEALAAALTDRAGCALPPAHVTVIGRDHARVTRAELLTALEAAVAQTNAAETLLVYFGGHGLTDAEHFYLCTSDTTPTALASTAVSGALLADVLRQSTAAGILVILDCCRSAGFAERAPAFFRELGASRFRILLAASRATEPSIELAAGAGTIFTTQLVRAVAGTEVVGRTPGLIYYSELLSYLDTRLTEEWRRRNLTLPQPQPVSVTVAARDPLIFVHRGMTLSQVRVREARFSRAEILRIVRRVAVATVAVAAFAAGTLYAFLDKSEFVRLDPEGIALYDGHPSIRAFGFPRRRWIVNIEPLHLQPDSPMRRTRAPVVAPLGANVMPLLERELKSEGRAFLRYRQGDIVGARAELRTFLASPALFRSEWAAAAVGLFEEIATAADLPRLRTLATSRHEAVRRAATLALLRWDRSEALRRIAPDLAENNWIADEVYRRLTGACDDSALGFLRTELAAPYRDVDRIIATAVRLQCAIPATDLFESLVRAAGQAERQTVMTYATFVHGQRFSETLLGVVARGRDVAFTDDEALRYADLVHAAALLGESPRLCAMVREARPPNPFLQRTFLAASVAACPARDLAAIDAAAQERGTATNLEYVLALVKRQWLTARVARDRLGPTNIGAQRALADVLAERSVAADLEVARLHLATENPTLQEPALRILANHRAAVTVPDAVFASPTQDVQEAAYRWKLATDRAAALRELRERMADDSANYLQEILSDVHLTAAELQVFRTLAAAGGIERRRSMEILALHAPTDEVVQLLLSPDALARDAAEQWVAARDDLAVLIGRSEARLRVEPTHPCGIQVLREFLRRRATYGEEIARMPQHLRTWRAELLLTELGNGPAGLRRWLQRLKTLPQAANVTRGIHAVPR